VTPAPMRSSEPAIVKLKELGRHRHRSSCYPPLPATCSLETSVSTSRIARRGGNSRAVHRLSDARRRARFPEELDEVVALSNDPGDDTQPGQGLRLKYNSHAHARSDLISPIRATCAIKTTLAARKSGSCILSSSTSSMHSLPDLAAALYVRPIEPRIRPRLVRAAIRRHRFANETVIPTHRAGGDDSKTAFPSRSAFSARRSPKRSSSLTPTITIRRRMRIADPKTTPPALSHGDKLEIADRMRCSTLSLALAFASLARAALSRKSREIHLADLQSAFCRLHEAVKITAAPYRRGASPYDKQGRTLNNGIVMNPKSARDSEGARRPTKAGKSAARSTHPDRAQGQLARRSPDQPRSQLLEGWVPPRPRNAFLVKKCANAGALF